MKRNELYRQCRLVKKIRDGEAIQTSYIPAEFAKRGTDREDPRRRRRLGRRLGDPRRRRVADRGPACRPWSGPIGGSSGRRPRRKVATGPPHGLASRSAEPRRTGRLVG